MNRYETNSKGTAPALSSILNQFSKMPRSSFDETRRKTFDASPFAIIPIECFQMFPNSEAYIRYSINSLTKNPTVRRLLSSMNIELRTYYCRNSDLWEGWNNFITRGRSGKLDLQIPYLNFLHTEYSPYGQFCTSLPYNPYSYLNISPAVKYVSDQSFGKNYGIQPLNFNLNYTMVDTGLLGDNFDITSSNTYNKGQSALPGVLYCKIAKEYQNSNLLQNNPFWYPENENHDLILPYNATECRTACYDYPDVQFASTLNSVSLGSLQPTNDNTSMPWLNVLYFRQRKGNYFNTGSPFPDLLRGDVPTLDVLSANIDFSDVINQDVNTTIKSLLALDSTDKISSIKSDETMVNGLYEPALTYDTDYNQEVRSILWDSGSISHNGNMKPDLTTNSTLLSLLNNATVSGINFSLSEWRRLATMTVFRERMARTDGSYNQMIQAQFQFNPHWHEHTVKYCGGSSQPMVFSEVVQQSEDGNSPLGTTAGRGFSSSSGNTIHVKSDDYGIFMTVMTITPDDYYSQGISRMWSELTQSEQYFPILNNLNPQAIKNKELYITGTDSDDEDVFNYQELFSHFKSRQNEVSGLMSLPISKVGDTGAYILNRLFDSKPEFNNKFVTGELSDNENLVFASTEQAQFIMSVVSEMKYIAPMPAVTQPSDMGISY